MAPKTFFLLVELMWVQFSYNGLTDSISVPIHDKHITPTYKHSVNFPLRNGIYQQKTENPKLHTRESVAYTAVAVF